MQDGSRKAIVAAEVGLVFDLTDVLPGHFTHEPRWDAAGSVARFIFIEPDMERSPIH